jgi:hypothetical protein
MLSSQPAIPPRAIHDFFIDEAYRDTAYDSFEQDSASCNAAIGNGIVRSTPNHSFPTSTLPITWRIEGQTTFNGAMAIEPRGPNLRSDS